MLEKKTNPSTAVDKERDMGIIKKYVLFLLWERARMLKYKGGTSSADLSFKAEMCLGHKADRTQAACFSSVKQLERAN